jgi:hypothetical protein
MPSQDAFEERNEGFYRFRALYVSVMGAARKQLKN